MSPHQRKSPLPPEPTPVEPPPAWPCQASLAGMQIGPWVLEAPLGVGGMGQVWLARRDDGLFNGQAAIKLVRDPLPDPQADARFAREGRILARLVHPNIARLLDAGCTPAGQRFLVLEHVDGERIDAYCDRRQLTVPARLRLFLQVCAAVTHAHAHLVVHRDLKPSNVLVQPQGMVKLLDFGVAKLLEEEAGDLTLRAGAALTPEYAAPEQVEGQVITTAADVYALGVLLYRLLCGCRPYGKAGQTPTQLARAVVEAEPLRLSLQATAHAGRADAGPPLPEVAALRATTPERLRRQLAGDLDNIVAKALRKRPADRYASAQALADDLVRHLGHEPVQARPDRLAYRLGKFAARHRAGVATGLLTLLATATGVGGMIWHFHKAQEHALQARQQAGVAEVQRQLAQHWSAHVQQESARAAERAAVAQLHGEQARQQAEAAERFRRQGEREAAQALRQRQRAQQQSARAEGLALQAKTEAAKAQATKQYLIDIFRTTSRLQPDPEKARRTTVRELLDAGSLRIAMQFEDQPEVKQELQGVLGTLQFELGELAAAQRLFETRLATLQRLHRTPHPTLAEAYLNLAAVLREAGKAEPAAKALDNAAAVLDALGDQQSVWRADLLTQRAQLLLDSPQRAAARGLVEAALRIHERLPPAVLGKRRLAWVVAGRVAAAENRWDAAVEAYRRAEALATQEFGPDSYPAAASAFWAGRILRAQGRLDEAEAIFRRSIAIFDQTLGATHYETRWARAHLGILNLFAGRIEEGTTLLLQTLEQSRRADGGDDPVVDYIRANLSEALLDQGRLAEAEAVIVPAATADAKLKPNNNSVLALLSYARLQSIRGRFAAAFASLDQARELCRQMGAERAGVCAYLSLMSFDVALAAGQLPQARAALEEAKAVPLAPGQGISRRLAIAQQEGELLLAEGHTVVARERFETLLHDLATLPRVTSPRERNSLALFGLGQAQLRSGQAEAARRSLEQALQTRQPISAPDSIWLARIRVALADALLALSERAAAQEQLAAARAAFANCGPVGPQFLEVLGRVERQLATY